MNNEIVKTEKSDWLSAEDKKVIRSQFFPQSATDAEMIYCMKVAESFNLNPILKQIYFVPRKTKVGNQWIEKVEPLAGRDSFLTLAHRTKQFSGIESKVEIKETPVLINNKWTRENDLVATATVYRKDSKRPFVVSVNYREYCQKKQDGTATKFWKEKPETMLKKVAESQVLRKAFDITGIYAEEELNDQIIDAVITPMQDNKEIDLNNISETPKKTTRELLVDELLKADIPSDKIELILNENEDKHEDWLKDKDDMHNKAMEYLF